MAAAAVAGCQMFADHKAVVILGLLILGRLVAIEAVHAVLGVSAHLVFMHNRVLQACMALRALAAGPDEVGGRLFGLDAWPSPIHEECTKDQSEGDGDSDENRAKRHLAPGKTLIQSAWEFGPSLPKTSGFGKRLLFERRPKHKMQAHVSLHSKSVSIPKEGTICRSWREPMSVHCPAPSGCDSRRAHKGSSASERCT